MRRGFDIVYRDRATGMLEREPVYAGAFLYWLYNTRPGVAMNALFFRRRLFSDLYGRLQRTGWSRRRIRRFVERLGVDLSEARMGPDGFRSFRDFFVREIDLSRRPIDRHPDTIVAPADGKVLAFRDLDPGRRFRVKRSVFDLAGCLGDDGLAARYAGGALVIQRLTLRDYHHFHFPVDGIPGQTCSLPGRYEAGGPYSLQSLVPFYGENHRQVTLIGTERLGQVAMVEVGAMTVGTIRQRYRPGRAVKRGDEKGHFDLGGSTIVLVFEPGAVRLDEDLCASTREEIETYVRMGERIGAATSSTQNRP